MCALSKLTHSTEVCFLGDNQLHATMKIKRGWHLRGVNVPNWKQQCTATTPTGMLRLLNCGVSSPCWHQPDLSLPGYEFKHNTNSSCATISALWHQREGAGPLSYKDRADKGERWWPWPYSDLCVCVCVHACVPVCVVMFEDDNPHSLQGHMNEWMNEREGLPWQNATSLVFR